MTGDTHVQYVTAGGEDPVLDTLQDAFAAVTVVAPGDAADSGLDASADCVVLAATPDGVDVPAFVAALCDRADAPCVLAAAVDDETLRAAYEAGLDGHVDPGTASALPAVVARHADTGEFATPEADAFGTEVLESTPVAVLTIDATGVVVHANDAIDAIFGYEPGELVGERLTVLMSDEVASRHNEALQQYLLTGERTLDWTYIELPGRQRDGHEVPLGVSFGEFRHDGDRYFTGVLRDITARRRHEERLAALNDLAQELADVETGDAVAEHVVAAARDVLDLEFAAVQRYDETTGRLQPAARTPALSEHAGDAALFAGDADPAWQAFADQEATTRADLGDDTPLAAARLVPLREHGVLVAGATTPGSPPDVDDTLLDILAAHAASALDRVARESALREQRDTLEEKNEALERLNRVNTVIRDITGTLVATTSREAALQAVCDRLVAVEPYEFAWVGRVDSATDAVEPEVWAGGHEAYLDAVTADDGDTGGGPTGRAVRTREPQVRDAIHRDPPFEQWRSAALERGFQSSIAVPVLYGDTTYAVLTLYAGEAEAFSGMERAVFGELGETIGYALNALERRDALVSQDSVELAFQFEGVTDGLLAFVEATGREFDVENVVGRADGSLRLYAVVRDGDLGRVRALADEEPAVGTARLIADREGGPLMEVTAGEGSLVAALLDHGAVLQSVRGTESGVRLVVRAPGSATVRSFVDLLESHADRVELVARRELDRPVRSQAEFEAALENQLTDRQAEVVQTAYVSGFFEWPRESNLGDLAEMLDVSQPTVSRHIRAGERTLFGLVFDDDAAR